MKFSSKAFTLIELLIVVAIIAILAAIAVPNFLEAQTRSKTSRVKADMRSIATALEAYRVDEQHYPPSIDNSGTWYSEINRLRRLTTPVAYITSLPVDAFIEKTVTPGERGYWDYSDRERVDAVNGVGTWESWGNRMSSEWRLASNGPDQLPNWRGTGATGAVSFSPSFEYDSTNGTVSFGDILRWGP